MTYWSISHNAPLYAHRPVFNELSYDVMTAHILLTL